MKILLAHNYYRSSAPSGEDAVFRNERELLEQNGIDITQLSQFISASICLLEPIVSISNTDRSHVSTA